MEVKEERRKKKNNTSGEAAAVKEGHKKRNCSNIFCQEAYAQHAVESEATAELFKKKRFCPYEPAESHFGSNYTVPLSRAGVEWQLRRKMSLRQRV